MKKPLMKAEMMEITPALAQKWLDLNIDNRTYSEGWIDTLKDDIINDRWHPNNSTIGIIVDDSGKPVKVADGQHRLFAVSFAGKSIWSWVVFGTEEELNRAGIDRVKPRSVADQLHLLYHVPHPKRTAAIINIVYAIEQESLMLITHAKMSVDKAKEIRDRHQTSIDWLFSVLTGGGQRKYIEKAPVAGVLVYAHEADPAKVDAFAKQVRDGENLVKTDPAYALRLYLDKLFTEGGVASRGEMILMTMRAVQAHLRGEKLSALKPGSFKPNAYVEFCHWFARLRRSAVKVRPRTDATIVAAVKKEVC